MDWKIISESEPTDVFTGKLWMQPSTGATWFRLGSQWIPIVSGSVPFAYNLVTLLINGEDKTSLLVKDTLTIEDILTKDVNTCSFTLDDLAGENKPEAGQEVIVFYKTSATATPVIRFGGRIAECSERQLSPGVYAYDVSCTDYSSDLQKHQVEENYTSQSAGDIIRDIIATYAPELGTYHVEDGVTVNYISFNYVYPFDCIQQLAELTGYDWYVDYERNIHFFPSMSMESDAPYSLTEDTTSGDYSGLVITPDKSQLRNAQTVRGGYQLSNLYGDDVQEAIAGQTAFKLQYEPYTPVTVYVDSGGGYVAHTLGIDNVDTSGFDFVVNQSEKLVKCLDHAALSAGDLVKVTYTYQMPIKAYVEDEDSIEAMKAIEGGDGIYEGALIVDDSIQTKAAARQRARAELVQYANPMVAGSFTTTQYGYRSGQILTVNIPSRGIDTQYMIQQVTATSIGMGNFEYEVTFATKLKGLTDFLIDMYDQGRKITERTDEVLDRLKVVKDTISVSDAVPTYSTRNIVSSPYVWSNDAGTTDGKGQWSLAQWG